MWGHGRGGRGSGGGEKAEEKAERRGETAAAREERKRKKGFLRAEEGCANSNSVSLKGCAN